MSAIRSSALRLSTRTRTTASTTLGRSALPFAYRTYATSEPPRSQAPPAKAGESSDKAMYGYVAIGLGIGAGFLFLMGRPNKAADAAKNQSTIPGSPAKQSLKGGDEK